MPMTRQLWTINGLATELGKDRRTLGRALQHVAADGTTRGGYQGWFMETALRALSHKGKASNEDAPTPLGFEVISRLHVCYGRGANEGRLRDPHFNDCALGD